MRQSPVAELLAQPLDPVSPSVPRIGLLHADLNASGGNYAPIRQSELDNTGYDAWYLGHIHKPSLQSSNGAADVSRTGYLGSLVGLDPTETGRHGPWLIELPGGREVHCRHLPLSPLRWEHLSVSVEGLEHVEKAFQNGKGVIGITAHFGNWEWGGVGLSLLGFPVHALVLNHKNSRVNQFFVRQRAQKGIHVVPLNHSIWETVQHLTKNEMLLLVADREFSNNGIPVSFLNRKVFFPRGPAALSRRCGSPLVVGFVIRQGKASFRLVFKKPIYVKKTRDPSQDLQRTTQKVATLLEETIRRYPTQWFLFQGFRELP